MTQNAIKRPKEIKRPNLSNDEKVGHGSAEDPGALCWDKGAFIGLLVNSPTCKMCCWHLTILSFFPTPREGSTWGAAEAMLRQGVQLVSVWALLADQ